MEERLFSFREQRKPSEIGLGQSPTTRMWSKTQPSVSWQHVLCSFHETTTVAPNTVACGHVCGSRLILMQQSKLGATIVDKTHDRLKGSLNIWVLYKWQHLVLGRSVYINSLIHSNLVRYMAAPKARAMRGYGALGVWWAQTELCLCIKYWVSGTLYKRKCKISL